MLRKEWLAHLDGLVVFRGLLATEPLRALRAALAAEENELTGAIAALEAELFARGTNWTDTLLNTVLEEENLCLRVAAGQDAGPVLEKALADELDGRIRVAGVNVDDAPDVAARFGVNTIPTLLLFKDGRLLGRPFVGPRSQADIREYLSANGVL